MSDNTATQETSNSDITMEEHKKEEVKQSIEQLKSFSFEEDLWDSLHAINDNSKRGAQLLYGLSHYCRNSVKALNTFAHSMQKANDVFERDMLKEKGLDTTTIAITNLKIAFDDIVKSL